MVGRGKYVKEQFEYNIEDDNKLRYNDIERAIEDTIALEKLKSESECIYDLNFKISECDVEGSYVEYIIEDLPVSLYLEGVAFEDMLLDAYRVKVPYITEEGERAMIVYALNEKGELKMQEETIIGETTHLYVAPEAVNEIIDEQIDEETEKVIYCYSDRYNMSLIYVKTVLNEYLIPFAKENTLNMDNGKVYTVKQFFKNMNKIFEEKNILGSLENNGLPYRKIMLWPYIMGISLTGAGVIATSICMYKLKDRKM